VSVAEFALLVAAGIGGGLTGSVAGLASLVSYPALLAVGLAPVSANVTNTVALVFSSVGSVSGSVPELRGQRARLTRLAPVGLLGGVAGAVLLLVTPTTAFARIVPWLIGLAALGIVAPRRLPSPQREHRGRSAAILPVAVFAIGIYGGYFGAAAGVLLLAVLLQATGETLARSNAVKNVVLGVANGVAAVLFALVGPVHWLQVLPLAAGFFLGGRLGPVVVRVAPQKLLCRLIALAGLGLAIYLGVQAY
jgi:uncharacterized protein